MSTAATGADAPRLSAGALAAIERETTKYPAAQRQSAVMAALAIAQAEVGWLPSAVMEEVAGVLGMAPVAVYEVATFYHMYNLKPVGRHKVTVCTNLPCALSGGKAAAEHLCSRLGVRPGQTSADGAVTLKEGECLGACGDAPVLLVDDRQLHGFMDESRLDALLTQLGARPA
jgi:NADH-quinone oxidoreductase subunit E